MKNKIIIKNTKGQDCEVYQGSVAVWSFGDGNCTLCRTHRIYDNGTVIFKLEDKPCSYKTVRAGEQVPFAYL